VKLMNPVQARQLCTSIDMPASTADVGEKVSEDVLSALQRSQDDLSEPLLLPDFPLLPVSRGFQMKLQKLLAQFETALTVAGITASGSSSPS